MSLGIPRELHPVTYLTTHPSTHFRAVNRPPELGLASFGGLDLEPESGPVSLPTTHSQRPDWVVGRETGPTIGIAGFKQRDGRAEMGKVSSRVDGLMGSGLLF